MRVSELFRLGRSQSGLDFVDVDIDTDAPIYIDPCAVRIQGMPFSEDCEAFLRSFFGEVLEVVQWDDLDRVRQLLSWLREPNETHLGLSKGKSRGRGLGRKKIEAIAENLVKSKAAKTGLLCDLEDSALFVEIIGRDTIPDMSTHIMKGALVAYTEHAANFYGIELVEQHCGATWDPDALAWKEKVAPLQ